MSIHRGHRVFAFYNGFKGLVDNDSAEMYNRSVGDILTRGGTIIGTARYPGFQDPEVLKKAAKNFKLLDMEGLIVIGGDGSFRGASELEDLGVPVIGLPGTIDNDITGTDFTIGYDTAVDTVLDCIKKLRDTASSHGRTIIIEVMGRHSGWIAMRSGLAGGAEAVLVPEIPFDLDELCHTLESGIARGKKHSLVVLAEGVMSASELAHMMKDRVGFVANTVVLGYVQRGGSPTANDIILASRLGARAVDEIAGGNSGIMIGEIKGDIVTTPLKDVLADKKVIDPTLFHLAADLVH